MANWRTKVKMTHLFTDEEDHETVQKTMNQVADILESTPAFRMFNSKQFRNIPEGDDFFQPIDYANKLINKMYDYADDNSIWIE